MVMVPPLSLVLIYRPGNGAPALPVAASSDPTLLQQFRKGVAADLNSRGQASSLNRSLFELARQFIDSLFSDTAKP